MSLQVWLPLTGHLNNQGLSNVSITNNGATVDNNGKIGKCYSFNGSNQYLNNTNFEFDTSNDYSTAFWMYFTALPTGTNARPIAICKNASSAYADTVFSISIDYINNGSQGKFAIVDGGAVVYYDYNFATGVWYHIALTKQGNTKKLYMNGQLLTTLSFGGSTRSYKYLFIGGVPTNSRILNGKLNDFRIYDHALSAKEVKELSKGLVLHYPLSAGFGGAENLFRDSAMGQHAIDNFVSNGSEDWTKYFRYYNGTTANHSFSDGIDTITLASGNNIGICFCRKATDIALDSSSYYTISCEAKCEVSGAHLDIGLSYYNTSNAWVWRGGSNPKNFTAVDTWQKFTHTFKPDANTQYIMYCFTINSTTGKHFSIRHCKLEKGEVATPWTMNMLDTEMADLAMTEYDVSGYNYHGTKVGTITYSSDSARYNVCNEYNKIGHIVNNSFGLNMNQFTINLWYKPKTASSQHFLIGTFNSWTDNGFGLYRDTNAVKLSSLIRSSAESSYCTSGCTITTTLNTWQMLTYVYDGTTYKGYLNGELIFSQNYGSNGTISNPVFMVANSKFNNTPASENEEAFMSDIRLYATALSADDIKELYNTAASLANNGTLFAYSFNEV